MPAMNTYFLCGSSIAEGKYGSYTCTESHENWDDQLIRKTKKLRRLKKPGILGGGKESGIPGKNKIWRLREQPSRKETRTVKPGN